MKSLLFRYAVLVVLLGAGMVIQSSAQGIGTVSAVNIRHVGPQAVSDELIRANIRLRAGESYNRSNVDDDVRNLYSTGYFYRIEVSEDDAAEGKVVTYVVQGKPLVSDVSITGNTKISDKRLRKKLESKTGEPLSERQLFLDTQVIRETYQKKGYQGTEVNYVLNVEEQTGKGSVVFEIKESPKVRLEDVEFLGVDAFTQRKLRKLLKTRRHWSWSWLTRSGRIKDDEFAEDKERLRQFFQSEGYIDFEIRDIEFDYETPTRLTIRFILFQGKQYKIGNVSFEGNELFNDEELRNRSARDPDIRQSVPNDLRLQEGEVFKPEVLRADRGVISDVYGTKGYIDAQVAVQKKPNTEKGTMDLDYLVREGDQSFIEKIQIRGNTKTKDKVIRRELAVSPGEVFDMVRVKRSQRRLEGLNFFDTVSANPVPTDIANRKDLVISVEEKNTGNLTFGAGFSTIEQLVGYVEMSQGNFDLFNPPYFTGDGQKFRVRATLGTQTKDYVISFIEPWFLDRMLQFSTDLYYRDIEYNSDEYRESRLGAKFGLTKALWGNYLRGTLSYTIEDVDLDFGDNTGYSQALIDEQNGQRLVSKVGTAIAYDTRPVDMFPNRGTFTKLETEVAGGPFGADTDYYLLELRSNWYFPGFFTGHSLQILSRVGFMDSYGDSDTTPLFDRLYLGGAYNMRGYDFREIGPRDYDPNDPTKHEPIGGHTYWFASAEYIIPIIDNFRLAFFYDIGNVYGKTFDFTPQDVPGRETTFYSDDVGIGIRLDLPIGPLRLDYAFPITDGDGFGRDGGRFNFGITTREF